MNNRLTNLLGVADWVANSFPTVRIVLMVLAVLCCACVIVLALVAPAGKENGNVITGSQTNETFYSQNKSHMNEGSSFTEVRQSKSNEYSKTGARRSDPSFLLREV